MRAFSFSPLYTPYGRFNNWLMIKRLWFFTGDILKGVRAPFVGLINQLYDYNRSKLDIVGKCEYCCKVVSCDRKCTETGDGVGCNIGRLSSRTAFTSNNSIMPISNLPLAIRRDIDRVHLSYPNFGRAINRINVILVRYHRNLVVGYIRRWVLWNECFSDLTIHLKTGGWEAINRQSAGNWHCGIAVKGSIRTLTYSCKKVSESSSNFRWIIMRLVYWILN